MFHIGDKVIIKYNPPLYMKGYIEYTYPIGTITRDFGNGMAVPCSDFALQRIAEVYYGESM